jgi:hypothetical protein
MIKLTFSARSRRKWVANTLNMLLAVFDGDEVAMYKAIEEHRANPTKIAVKSPPIEPTASGL